MNAPTPNRRDPGHDKALKDRLKATLAQGSAKDATEALQARVLAQWRQARPQGEVVMTSSGPVASLQAAWRQHPLMWAGALALLVVALWALRPARDPALDELMQPDVLTLISSGEL